MVEAARAFTGWIVHVPGGRQGRQLDRLGIVPWGAGIVPDRHDVGAKTILGDTAEHDLGSTIDLLLDHPATAEHVAAKLFHELTGLWPSATVRGALASTFRSDYRILPLVEAIVTRPELVSDAAVRSRVRTPLEKAMTLIQAFGPSGTNQLGGSQLEQTSRILQGTSYAPFLPPNPAGYPEGEALLGPYQLTHALDLLWLVPERLDALTTVDAMRTVGIVDADPTTVAVVDGFAEPHAKLASVLAAPEMILT